MIFCGIRKLWQHSEVLEKTADRRKTAEEIFQKRMGTAQTDEQRAESGDKTNIEG
jgi:hypothetical protein